MNMYHLNSLQGEIWNSKLKGLSTYYNNLIVKQRDLPYSLHAIWQWNGFYVWPSTWMQHCNSILIAFSKKYRFVTGNVEQRTWSCIFITFFFSPHNFIIITGHGTNFRRITDNKESVWIRHITHTINRDEINNGDASYPGECCGCCVQFQYRVFVWLNKDSVLFTLTHVLHPLTPEGCYHLMPVYREKETPSEKGGGSSSNVIKLPPPLNHRDRDPYQLPTLLNTWALNTWPPSPLLPFTLKSPQIKSKHKIWIHLKFQML